MKRSKINFLAGCVTCAIFLNGCGGGQTPDAAAATEIQRGLFLDSAVQGLEYRTDSQSGITDSDGGFNYIEGESVVFSIGGIEFPEVTARTTITPVELASTKQVDSEEVVNILRLLQSLDADLDASNGIEIPQSARENVTAPQITFSVDFEQIINEAVVQTYAVEREIVQPQAAVDHLVDTLSKRAGDSSTSAWNLAFLHLVEEGRKFDESYISVRDTDYEINLNEQWENGSATKIHNVYQLAGPDQKRFLSLGTGDDGSKLACLAARPTGVGECVGSGRLFDVFTDKTVAREFSANQLAQAALEPEFEAAQEESAQASAEEEKAAAEAEAKAAAAEAAEAAAEAAARAEAEANAEAEAKAKEEAENSKKNALTVVTTTDCPTQPLKAPVSFQVYAAHPAGCKYAEFTEVPWTWTAGTNYDGESNTVTATVGGKHIGTFQHTCTDTASGREVIVTASCEVTVDAPQGVSEITDLFFLTGQSNAASLQTAYDEDLDSNDHRVFAFTDNGWQQADLHQFWDEGIPGNYSHQYSERDPYNSIVFQVAKALAEKSDRVVGIVMLTAPGEGISNWDYNSEFFVKIRDKAIAALNALPHKNSFDSMLWLQGETDWLLEGTADPGATGFSDTTSEFYRNYYPNKLFQLINNFRSEGWLRHDGRFICAETKKAGLNDHLMALNSDSDDYTGCAAASDLATRDTDPYGNHFSAASLRTLGDRIADIYLGMTP